MIVEIKGHKYEVDFGDLRTLEIADSVREEIAAGAFTGEEEGIALMRKQMQAARAFLDRIVGDGVSDECFGESQDYLGAMRALGSVLRAYYETTDEMKRELGAMAGDLRHAPDAREEATTGPAPIADIRAYTRKPVRVE